METSSAFPQSDKPKYNYFWQKPQLYKNETRIWRTNIPAWRFFVSVCMVYGFYIGVDFINYLCTAGFQFISAVSLIAAMIYIYWALWWDEPIIIPPTQTFFNTAGYYTISSLLCIAYETSLIGIVVFCIVSALLFTYLDFSEIFKWTC